MHGFAKNELDNIGKGYLALLKKAAKEVLATTDDQVKTLLQSGAWKELDKSTLNKKGQKDHGNE